MSTHKKRVLSKFTVLYWATFIAILGHIRPTGCRLDTPGTQLFLQLFCKPKNYFKIKIRKQYILKTSCIPGSVLDPGDTAVNNMRSLLLRVCIIASS